MSNINQNNFNNCFNLRLSNSDYWDLFLCTDCGCGLDHESILEACLIIDIDVDVDMDMDMDMDIDMDIDIDMDMGMDIHIDI